MEKEAVMQYSDALQHFHVALLLTEIHIFGFKFKIYIYIFLQLAIWPPEPFFIFDVHHKHPLLLITLLLSYMAADTGASKGLRDRKETSSDCYRVHL